MIGNERDLWANRATKMALTGVLLGSMLVFGKRSPRNGTITELRPLDVVLLGLASYRTGRIIAFERVAEPIRAPFTETVPDDSGFGETVVARGRGARWALGELFSCPICLATWVAAGLHYALDLIPRPTRNYIHVMGIAGVAELVYGLSETLSWFGHAKRAEAGSHIAEAERNRRRVA